MATSIVEPDVYAAVAADRAPRAVYFHVPFCLHRCGYCDFTLVAQKDELIPFYLQALENELSRMDRVYDVDTIFIGGGTPTHLSAQQLTRFGKLVANHFRLANNGEYSIEANPDGLDNDRLAALNDVGVNRLSLGVQSFDDSVLRTLERQHSAKEAQEVVRRAQQTISNISLDLIFGVPGQTPQSWQKTLDTACRLPLKHISTYGLTFEKGTDFFQRRSAGALAAVSDDIERDMYAHGIDRLQNAGFMHYEISNFAKPGSHCRHNDVYWAANEYFAFGPGAARYVNGTRSTNARNVTRWIRSWQTNRPALQDHETLNDDAKAREAIYLGLRKVEGIMLDEFADRFNTTPAALAADNLNRHLDDQLLEIINGHLRLTTSGRFIADSVIADFL